MKKDQRSFKSKLTGTVLISVISISVIVIVLTTIVSGKFIIESARQIALKQEELSCNALSQELASIYQLGKIIQSDDLLKEDLENIEKEEKYIVFSNDIYAKLLDFQKMNGNIDYIVFLKYNNESIKYVGRPWYEGKKEIYKNFQEDYKQSLASNYDDMKSSITNKGFLTDEYYINFYFPIYDSKKVYKEIGIIGIGVKEDIIAEYYSNTFFDTAKIVDFNNVILSSQKKEEIGTKSLEIYDEQADYYKNLQYIFRKKIDVCNWSFVAEISSYRLLQNSVGVFFFSMGIVFLICILASFICFRWTKKLTHPLEDIKTRMRKLAGGDMDIRMDIVYQEEEFNEMAKSFNGMVIQVDELMNRIKEEQMQMKQIELNALQSQIKPHFLYNTLECIHMQSVVDGNIQITKLVKALAVYYRLCLSKGQDIVYMQQEILHIENYLIIQNIRYSNIISCEVIADERYAFIKIPKMTLQPLIENAIYHGIKGKESKKGKILIYLEEDNEAYILKVKDDGKGMSLEKLEEINLTIHIFDEQYGYGIRNVNRRIQILFGMEFGLHYSLNELGGVTVEIRLPKYMN